MVTDLGLRKGKGAGEGVGPGQAEAENVVAGFVVGNMVGQGLAGAVASKNRRDFLVATALFGAKKAGNWAEVAHLTGSVASLGLFLGGYDGNGGLGGIVLEAGCLLGAVDGARGGAGLVANADLFTVVFTVAFNHLIAGLAAKAVEGAFVEEHGHVVVDAEGLLWLFLLVEDPEAVAVVVVGAVVAYNGRLLLHATGLLIHPHMPLVKSSGASEKILLRLLANPHAPLALDGPIFLPIAAVQLGVRGAVVAVVGGVPICIQVEAAADIHGLVVARRVRGLGPVHLRL